MEAASRTDNHALGDILILGNLQTGKTTLFHRLCGERLHDVNIPSSSDTVTRGEIRSPWHLRMPVLGGLVARVRGLHVSQTPGDRRGLLDTPGTATLFAQSEEELVAAEALLRLSPSAVLLVADAKNLRRSMALLLSAAQFGLPAVLVLNMMDEARERGWEIDNSRLARMLGIDLVEAVALHKVGVHDVARKLSAPRPLRPDLVEFPRSVEETLGSLADLLVGVGPAPRGVALLLLAGDPTAAALVRERLGEEIAARARVEVDNLRRKSSIPLDVLLTDIFYEAAERLVASTVRQRPRGRRFLERLGGWAQHPLYGLPLAALVVLLLYLFVGELGASRVVDALHGRLLEERVTPWCNSLVNHLPWPVVREAIMDPDFGLVPTGLFLAFGIVLPVLLFFYVAFALLQDTGYLPRLSVLLDRLFRVVGLNGRGVLPLAMGFSCVTMALLTTRMLESKRERIIASLLVLGLPCAPLLGVMLVILVQLPASAVATMFGLIGLRILVAGHVASRLLPGRGSDFIIEIPPMRIPRFRHILRVASRQTYSFMKEAIPFFLLASLALFAVARLGGLVILERAARPVTQGLLGLPDTSVQVFIKTLIRRENGAAELEHVGTQFSNLQLVVTLVVMTFLSPCVNAVLVLFKERGARTAGVLLAAVSFIAILAGTMVNHLCRWLDITFV